MEKRGLLVRVGIDSSQKSGNWNAPIDENGRFVFVPISDMEYNDSGYVQGGERTYENEVLCELKAFAEDCGQLDHRGFQLPRRLHRQPMHLDPDFQTLTYGDDPIRGKKLGEFGEGSFLAFYSSFKSLTGGRLVYALIGLLVLAERPRKLGSSTPLRREERLLNAHTRWRDVKEGDLVAHGKEGESGLLERAIPIGEWRLHQGGGRPAYRVYQRLLDEWGGLTPEDDGWIQRSAVLPEFNCPDKFLEWFYKRNIALVREQYRAKTLRGASFKLK